MQHVVAQLGRRLATVTTATLNNNNTAAAMDSLRQQKKALRTIVRRELRNFSPETKRQEDEAIQKHVLSTEWYQNSKRICAYVSCASLREVETSHIMADLLEKHRRVGDMKVYVPRIEDKESHMKMLHITNTDDDLIANYMNILEPTPLDSSGKPREEVMQTTEPLDLLLLPGLAFDRKGGRLGRGGGPHDWLANEPCFGVWGAYLPCKLDEPLNKSFTLQAGYYDLFLQNYLLLAKDKGWKAPLLVALSYSPQIRDDAVPVDATDVNIDALVCSNGILTFSSQAEKQINSS